MNVSSTHFTIAIDDNFHRDLVNGGNVPIVGPCQVVFETVGGDGQFGFGLTFHVFPTGRDGQVYDLIDLIEEHGGTAIDHHKEKIGRVDTAELADGFALIDPSQVWAPDFFKERRRNNPDTDATIRFINWGFPNLCVERDEIIDLGVARKLLTFTQTAGVNGGWSLYFSGSIREDDHMVRKNTQKVTQHGGRLAGRERSAMIVIVLDDELDDVRPYFEDNILSRVESQGWFLNCLDVKYVQFTPPPRKPMPGRVPVSKGGKVRVEFTQEDDRNLVQWLATRPNRSRDGLSGTVTYRKLLEQEFASDERHTWQSWRNRYVKNKAHFNKQIEAYLKSSNDRFLDGHGRDPRNRRYNRRSLAEAKDAGREHSVESESGSDDPSESENDIEEPIHRRQRKRRRIESEEDSSEDEEEAEARPGPEGSEDNEFGVEHEDAGPDEFYVFNEDIERVPSSTPPRVVQATFGSSRSTLVGNATGKLNAPPTQVREPDPMETEQLERYGGLFGVPLPSDEEEDELEEEDETDEPPPPAEPGAENGSQVSSDDDQEEVPASSALPHLDQDEIRQQRIARSTRAAKKSSQSQVQDEVEDENIPARTFQVSGSVRKPNASFPGSGNSVYTPRSQRPAQRAVRASGIFPASKGSTRATKTK